jgi:SAM-dependent methyltransferase
VAGHPRHVSPPSLAQRQAQRWDEVLGCLSDAIAAGSRYVVVDDAAGFAAGFADRLADHLRFLGQPCARLSGGTPFSDEDGRTDHTAVVADGPRWRTHPPAGRWELVIWLRTPADHRERGLADHLDRDADVVIDLQDGAWPVISRLSPQLAGGEARYLRETQAFFSVRAANWDAKFGDDLPAYTAAVAEAGIAAGATILDVGCGTGRALPVLRAAAGPAGTVLGVDVTAEMLTEASHRTGAGIHLVRADVRRLPLPAACIDAVFAAGLIQHLPDPAVDLRELARVTRVGGRLVLFHPSGRAALAARHGRTLRPDEPLAETPLRNLLHGAGFRLERYDDPPHRFLVLATRTT